MANQGEMGWRCQDFCVLSPEVLLVCPLVFIPYRFWPPLPLTSYLVSDHLLTSPPLLLPSPNVLRHQLNLLEAQLFLRNLQQFCFDNKKTSKFHAWGSSSLLSPLCKVTCISSFMLPSFPCREAHASVTLFPVHIQCGRRVAEEPALRLHSQTPWGQIPANSSLAEVAQHPLWISYPISKWGVVILP